MSNETNIEVIEKDTELTPFYKETPIVEMEYSPAKLKEMLMKVNDIYRNVMVKDTHYGIIPGTTKPTLYKSGAEVLCLTFNLGSRIDIIQQIEDLERPYFDYTVKCKLFGRKLDKETGEGIGSCNTAETRYATRKGRTSTRDEIYTLKNTVLKMAKKRAFVDATLTATNASAIFTQDIEDMKGVISDDLDDYDNEYDTSSTQKTVTKTLFVDPKKKLETYTPFKPKTEATPKTDNTERNKLTSLVQDIVMYDIKPKTEPKTDNIKLDTSATIIQDGITTETPSTPNTGMLYTFQWSMKEESQIPIPITGEHLGKYNYFKGIMSKMSEKGIMFQEVIRDEKLIGLYCNEIDVDHQERIEKTIKWILNKTFSTKEITLTKEETPVDMVPLS